MSVFKRVLVATDLSETSRHALEMGVALARESGAELVVMHVCEVPAYAYTAAGLSPADLLTPVVEVAETKLRELVDSIRGRHPNVRILLNVGIPWERVLAAASEAQADGLSWWHVPHAFGMS